MGGQHTSAFGHWSAVGVHYLQHKRQNPAVFSFRRALGSNVMTHRFIASNTPLLLGQAPQCLACSHFLHTKGKEESSLCQMDAEPGARMCWQGEKLFLGYLQLSSNIRRG